MEEDSSDLLEPGQNHPAAGNICAIDKKSVHRICSGQVVLTLATAVKELLENSIDAGATIIDIKLKDYGSEQIEVSDNGGGVHENNFEGLTLKHHTSKLQDFSDLMNVNTFGFRGEALSSLCALSTLSIATRHKDAAVGTRLEYDHNGKILKQSKQARQVGTTVTIQNLFCTLPVRHKEFQRNLKKEFVKMVQVLNSYCIISTGVRITCTNQTGKGSRSTVVSSKGNINMLENISNVFGPKQVQSLIEFQKVDPNEEHCTEFGIKKNNVFLFSIEGFVSKCEHGQGRSSTDRQFFFINGRPFDSTKLSKVVNDIYHQYNRHQYPFVVFKIAVQKDNVDVNVTPDKRQVFLEGEKIILATVKASLVTMYEPTTSVLQYQLPTQVAGKTVLQSENTKFTRLTKHLSLEKPTGLSSLMKLKRSFNSAFAKDDSSDNTSSRSTPSGSGFKQRRLDSFVSSYRSPKKCHVDLKQQDLDWKNDSCDVIVISDIKPEETVKQINSGKCDVIEHIEVDDRKEAFLKQIPDETGDHIKALDSTCETLLSYETNLPQSNGDMSTQNTQRATGQEAESDNCIQDSTDCVQNTTNNVQNSDNFSQGSIMCVQTSASGVLNSTNSVQNSDKCVQESSNIIPNYEISVQNSYDCVQNDTLRTQTNEDHETFIHNIIPHVSKYSKESADISHVTDKNLNQFEEHIVESKVAVNGSHHGEESVDMFPVSLVTTGAECDNRKEKLETRAEFAVITHEDKESVDEKEQEHDYEEDVERKERKIAFSMDQLRKRWNCRRKTEQSDSFSRAFRATISPTENQAAEQELQKEIKKDMFSKMEILGQFNLGFIITKLEKDLFIVDQHATDEKFNFETLQRDTVIQSQKLICPLNLELTSSNEIILMDNIQIFKKNGFEFVIDEEGLPTQRVKLISTPVSKNWNFGKEDIEEMIFMLTDSPGIMCRPSRVRAMFASRACRKSIMIGTTLNKAEMKKLVCHMGEIEHPWNCPHGRPTMRHLINIDMVPR